jgi:probable F420-dependent oxidoreductase
MAISGADGAQNQLASVHGRGEVGMQIGVMFPQNEIGSDVADIRAFTAAAVAVGCGHIWATDHVIGADTARRPDWKGAYGVQHEFHEPLILFAYLAAICDLELVTGVIILPQRQTVLVAKQAANLDILCQGRLRLGVGVGWNPVEFEALGQDFHARGRRLEEQVALMRKLWTEPVVDFEGEFDVVRGAGLAPLPIQRPIPVWMGAGDAPAALRRVGRLADGYLAQRAPGPGSPTEQHLAHVREGARAAGRDPASLGLQGLLPIEGKSDALIRETATRWRDLGATHLSIDPRAVSLHVREGLSMEEKVRSKAPAARLIENLQRGAEAAAGL